MKGFLIAYGIIAYIVNIILCGWLAGEKKRGAGSWVLLSIVFPGIALIAIAGAPDNNPVIDYSLLEPKQPAYWEGTKCPICSRECEEGESLQTHMKVLHPDIKLESKE